MVKIHQDVRQECPLSPKLVNTHTQNETCVTQNLDRMENCLQWKTFTVLRILCKDCYKTTFYYYEQKLSNLETESKDKTLAENILHVFI